MKYSLLINPELSFEQLETEVAKCGRFIVFPYCISLVFAVTLRRLSPAIFITDNEQFAKYARRYRTISLICGWWCIPWGFVRTPEALKTIRQGGIDVTKDIMLNLDAAGLASGTVTLQQIHNIFSEPDASALKSMKKTLLPVFNSDTSIHQIVAGLFINTDKPYYTIGLKADGLAEFYAGHLKTALYKDFYKNVRFEFIDLSSAEGALLKEQGVMLFDRMN